MDDTKRQPQELVHGRANGLHLGFAIVGVGVVEQAVIQIMDKRIVLGGNDGRHVESAWRRT